ncbi:MAG: hypothetical protein ACUVWV_05755 [Thermodesulfobacteriota bacterium]
MVNVINWDYFSRASKTICLQVTRLESALLLGKPLDFSALGIEIDPKQVGNSKSDP